MCIAELVILSKKNNEEAILELIKRLRPLVISSINKYYSIGEYEDLIQEGNILIMESIEKFDTEYGVHFLGYIKSKLKYYYLNKNKVEKEFSLNELDDNGVEFIERIVSDINIEDMILKEIENRYLLSSLNKITEREKEIVLKFYFEELSLREIAEELNIKYQTVANLKTNAIKKLKFIVKKL